VNVKPRASLPLPTYAAPASRGWNAAASTCVAMPEELPPPRDFSTLYRSTVAPLRRYLSRLLGNSAEAEDVAHDAYLRVLTAVESNTAERPEALVYVTARRLAINRLKRRSISPISREVQPPDSAAAQSPGVTQQVMARQELDLLEEAILELPEGCRSVLLLRKVELLSHREISSRLGIAISTVEKQHARALRLLRAAMKRATGETCASDAATGEEGS
jgi:RNA polymerase sigma-70 factor (ECF subfamily)